MVIGWGEKGKEICIEIKGRQVVETIMRGDLATESKRNYIKRKDLYSLIFLSLVIMYYYAVVTFVFETFLVCLYYLNTEAH